MRATLAAVLQREPEQIPENADLLDLGLDSLGMLRVINLWRRAGIRMALEDFTAEPTLAAWARHTRTSTDGPAHELETRTP
ncbi:phosphopantetheine-binding protein [Nocardia arizonensis]|uniref:phosphopantetheine-binding protein n=1 Tax=Nocardia arizonensis TaxID=1141647 RepID=UPI000686A82B|nr:phosphopantetheine-binding protein [Nocardia arizonensis]